MASVCLGPPAIAEEIHLTVTDASGAALSASGRVDGRLRRAFHADAAGKVTLVDLPVGKYDLTVSKRGFTPQQLTLELIPGGSLTRTVILAIAATNYSVEVVGSTPLAGGEVDRNRIALPVQSISGADLERSGSPDLAGFLNRRLSGVHLNEIQGNPFQPDLNYRGYTASPLLGTPQGLSIYMDGVRLNQPFGDVVSWDLIPRTAILETTVIPGSNPLFGLNTLGGAIAIETKTGLTSPDVTLTLSGGSWGRKIAELEYGGHNTKGLDWYGSANLFFEDGWRAASPSNVRQFFGKLSWHGAKTALALSVSYANNSLAGNGLQEQRFLLRDYASIYTLPDLTVNRSPFVNLTANRTLNPSLSLAGNVYYRYIRAATLNADINQDSLDQSIYQPNATDLRALAAAGYTGVPTSGANASNTPFPFWRCLAQVLDNGNPDLRCNGLSNRTATAQQNYGVAGQVNWTRNKNQLTGGAAYDRRTSGFRQLSQFGYLNPDRSVTPVNAFADTAVNLDGRAQTASVYATDTFTIARGLSLNAAGRYNRNTIRNLDRLTPGGGPGSLDGQNTFARFNPAAGVTYNPWRPLTAYFSYSEASRAPTSIELGCADPTRPCKLPNALAGDPPLRQVVTRTLEAGLRGAFESGLHWSAGWFRAENQNDLLFAASTQTGFGYFRNFGKTRRQGLEVDLHGRAGRLDWGGGYTFLDATYRSPETVTATGNSTNVDDAIQIGPGDRIPLIPRNALKAYALWKATSRLNFDLDLNAIGRSYARGNENNLARSSGPYYLGQGIAPGYAVLNAAAHFDVNRRLQLFAQANNVTGRRYYSAAQLEPTAFSSNGNFIARPFPAIDGNYPLEHATFYAPGAPRGIWGGIRVHF